MNSDHRTHAAEPTAAANPATAPAKAPAAAAARAAAANTAAAGARTAPSDGKPIMTFATAREFDGWLAKHHATHAGFWLRIFKKAAGRPAIRYAEALDVALCYGWIDGQRRRHDAASWLLKLTRRGARSPWSKINTGHVERLTRLGRMQPAGIAAVDAAQADGRWADAYGSSAAFEMPPEFTRALAKSPKAAAFFATLNKANRYAIFYRLQSARRPETKAQRLRDFLAMLERGEKLH